MSIDTLSVGSYEVHTFLDGLFTDSIDQLLHGEGPAARQRAIEAWGQREFTIDVNCFGLHGPDGLILIDAGTGTAWGPHLGHAESAMRAAGFTREQVSTVLLTHIHGDHTLGLFDGGGPRFPNADVLLPRAELDHFGDAGRKDAAPPNRRAGFLTVDRLREAYGVQLKPVDVGPVLPGIEAIALPGHTPGHTGYLVHDDRRAALFWADVVHLGELQLADPDLGFIFDIDPAAAIHSRRHALESAAREGWYVCGSHVHGINRIARKGGGYVFVEE
jgi:glyoxylase-like metal-dependent hydrolase (beta-lactamase superfamily II)